MFSRRAHYGLLAVLHLAKQFGSSPVLIADLAAEQCIPKKFLEQILLDLRKARILESKSGKGGGYRLGRPPGEITLGEVIEVLDGRVRFSVFSGKKPGADQDGSADQPGYAIHMIMTDVSDAISRILDYTTLEAALRRSRTVSLRAAGKTNSAG